MKVGSWNSATCRLKRRRDFEYIGPWDESWSMGLNNVCPDDGMDNRGGGEATSAPCDSIPSGASGQPEKRHLTTVTIVIHSSTGKRVGVNIL